VFIGSIAFIRGVRSITGTYLDIIVLWAQNILMELMRLVCAMNRMGRYLSEL
jgi:hypothetical protein